MARIGYGRVSTRDQHPGAQRRALEAAGCAPGDVFIDHGVSGKLASRPQLDACLAYLRAGDVLVVTRLDRLGRSTRNLIGIAELLKTRGVDLVCLEQPVDTTSAAGKMFFTILAAFAEFEHALIVERTREGLAATTARGRNGGRKPVLKPYQVQHARQLVDQRRPVAQIAAELGVSRATLYRALERDRKPAQPS